MALLARSGNSVVMSRGKGQTQQKVPTRKPRQVGVKGESGERPPPETAAEAQRMLEEDPAMAEKAQQVLQSDEMQKMQSFLANPEVQQRLESLKEDPEFEGFFQDVQENPQKILEYWRDEEFLKKFSERLGIQELMQNFEGEAVAQEQAPLEESQDPENLLDAVRLNDFEAIEDFCAIGQDANVRDEGGRTPLHYASAITPDGEVAQVVNALVSAGADVNNKDNQGNTPTHYAAGYGRIASLRALKSAGADPSVPNGNGQTAAEAARLNKFTEVFDDGEVGSWVSDQ